MAKVYMITFHTPKNYGALLQAFSLMSYFERNNVEVKVVDYNTPHLRSLYPVIPKVHSIKTLILATVLLPTYRRQKRKYEKFDEFVHKRFKLTKRFESTQALYQESWDNCIFVTGSDQVFNPKRIQDERKVFYLDFVPANCKRIAYAASFGVKTLPESMHEEICSYLRKFDYLSVREESGKEIIRGLIGVEVDKVLDPVFLNDVGFWRQYEKRYETNSQEYLLYYRLLGAKESDHTARKIARSKQLKLVVVTNEVMKIRADQVLRDVGPDELLYLISHAAFIVTDSFHGIAFSIIYRKQFVFSNENDNSNQRGLNLLKNFRLDKCAYGKTYNTDKLINYPSVEQIIDAEISNSQKCVIIAIGRLKEDL